MRRRRARTTDFPDSFLPSVAKAADEAMEDVLIEDFLRHLRIDQQKGGGSEPSSV